MNITPKQAQRIEAWRDATLEHASQGVFYPVDDFGFIVWQSDDVFQQQLDWLFSAFACYADGIYTLH